MLKVILKKINKDFKITLALRACAFFKYYFDYFEVFLTVFIARFHKRTRRLIFPNITSLSFKGLINGFG